MSKVDPIKRDGKIREQLHREEKSRREYPKKWNFMQDPELNRFYDQDYIEDQLKVLVPKEKYQKAAYEYTGHGDSYFVSKGMFEPINLCRCGRKKEGLHHLKCMQYCKIKYSIDDSEADEQKRDMQGIPRTLSGRVGWPPPGKYLSWEKSTYYISPKWIMTSPKVTDHPYNAIILG